MSESEEMARIDQELAVEGRRAAVGRLLWESGRTPLAVVRCSGHGERHALAKFFDIDGEILLVRPAFASDRRFDGGSGVEPDRFGVIEHPAWAASRPNVERAPLRLTMRCPCGQWQELVVSLWRDFDNIAGSMARDIFAGEREVSWRSDWDGAVEAYERIIDRNKENDTP